MNSVPPDIARQLAEARAVLERHLAGNLRAIHLFGSAVDGGLKPHSDIDLLVTVDSPLGEAGRRALYLDLLAVSAWPGASSVHRALEVTLLVLGDVLPWRYPARREFQFGEWLREELEREQFPEPELDHDLAIILSKARAHSLCLAGPPAAELFAPVPRQDFEQALRDTAAQWNTPEDWEGDELTVVLALARVWLSLCTGEIASKDTAADWALARLPAQHRPALAAAKDAYLGRAPDRLAERGEEVEAFVRCVRGLLP